MEINDICSEVDCIKITTEYIFGNDYCLKLRTVVENSA